MRRRPRSPGSLPGTNFRPGSTEYLGKHSHVSTRMWKGLGKQGQLAYKKKAQKWNKESPPRDVQKR